MRCVDECGYYHGELYDMADINKLAQEYFRDNPEETYYKIGLVDFEKMHSSILEFTCERIVKIECIEY